MSIGGNMDLSIILAHYLPSSSHPCLDAVKRTVRTLEEQSLDLDVEIIVCDDGSLTEPEHPGRAPIEIKLDDGRTCYDFQGEDANRIARERLGLATTRIGHWLYLPRTKPASSKARLWNLATSLARADRLIFFDDDNYLIKDKGLNIFNTLLNDYKLVFGQIVDSNGRPRPYTSKRVQGSTFGIHRKLLNKIGGFGIWTESVSSGIDSDIWFRLYQELKNDLPFSAAFTASIQSFDGCSKRWKPFVGSFLRHRVVRKEFHRVNGCKNYRSATHNPSRNKTLWIHDLS